MAEVVIMDKARVERAVKEFLELYRDGQKAKAGQVILNSPRWVQEEIRENIRRVLKESK